MVGSEERKMEEAKAVSASAPVGTAPFNAFAGNGIIGRFGPAGQLSGSMPTAMALDGQKPLGVGGSTANVPVVQNAPTFQKDDTKKDGGFFGWLGGLIKKRPGIRSGESADEYDERMTRNKMRIATLADAIRHMGNIYNTSKGAPLQRFNNPVEGLQSGLQQRKNDRARQAALDADAAYKYANLRMKQASADADRAYKAMNIELKQKAGERADKAAKAMDDYRKGMLGIQEGNLKLSGERLGETKRHNRAQEGISASRLALARAKSGSGRGGKTSGGKYWFEDKNGKMHYQPNKTMWEQEYYREYGALPNGESNTSVSTKAYNSKGEEVTTTQRKKGPSMTSQAAQQQNKARASRKNNAKPKKRGWASGFKL
jgi:hypothetical protein